MAGLGLGTNWLSTSCTLAMRLVSEPFFVFPRSDLNIIFLIREESPSLPPSPSTCNIRIMVCSSECLIIPLTWGLFQASLFSTKLGVVQFNDNTTIQ